MKRSVCSILLILCVVLCLALPVSAVGGSISDCDAVWSYEDGVLTISGQGSLITYAYKPWSNYISQITTIVVEDGITSIGNKVFSGHENVTSITIADSVTEIGENAFYGCSSLMDVKLPANLTSLGANSFTRCTFLTEITLPDTLTTLSDGLFSTCTSLTTVHFPTNVTSLGSYTFSGSGLTELTLPEGITSLGEKCFYGCQSLKQIVLPSTLTTMGDSAFQNTTALTSIEIPGSLSVIPENAFGASGLQKAVISEGVTYLDRFAFSGCRSLSDVTLPSTVTELDHAAFARCPLTQILLPEGLTVVGREAFDGCKLVEVSLPSTLTNIGAYAFRSNELTSVKFPSGIHYIGSNAFTFNPLSAIEFDSCDNLIIASSAFSGTDLVQVHLPEGTAEIGDSVFRGCDQLTTVTMPDTVTTLGNDAFRDCTSLTSIQLSAGIDRLMPGSLQNTNLPELVIPYGVEWIYNGALDGNLQMTKLVIPATVTYVEPSFRSTCYNALIHCQKDTYIQRFCDSKRIEYQLIDDFEFEESYPIHILTNMGGTVSVSRESSPSLRYITLTAVPKADWAIYSISIYCDTDESYILDDKQLSDTKFEFMMPPGETWIEVLFVAQKAPFVDVPEDSFYFEPILWAVYSGITNGVDDTHFAPNQPCNRAQVVTFLWRAAGEPDPISMEHNFVDVEKGGFYEKAVLWAVENGITNGIDDTHFGPNVICNRASVVTFLWRARGCPAPSSTTHPFTDVPAGCWYESPVLWALETGITNGMSATEFGATTPCNRAQVVTFLYRYFLLE